VGVVSITGVVDVVGGVTDVGVFRLAENDKVLVGAG